MIYKSCYKTKENFSDIILTSDGKYLTGLFFAGYKNDNKFIEQLEKKELTIFKETERWLDMYFEGQQPDFDLKYKISNLTSFRKEVLDIALKIPYGKTSSYGDIAKKIAERHKIDKMSAQAVGSAIGFNPISIIIPCHRVVGSDGSISGYGGGIDNKIELLKLEKVIVDDDSYVVKY